MGIPSKGRMAEDTMNLLDDCQLKVRKINPRQYAAEIPRVEYAKLAPQFNPTQFDADTIAKLALKWILSFSL